MTRHCAADKKIVSPRPVLAPAGTKPARAFPVNRRRFFFLSAMRRYCGLERGPRPPPRWFEPFGTPGLRVKDFTKLDVTTNNAPSFAEKPGYTPCNQSDDTQFPHGLAPNARVCCRWTGNRSCCHRLSSQPTLPQALKPWASFRLDPERQHLWGGGGKGGEKNQLKPNRHKIAVDIVAVRSFGRRYLPLKHAFNFARLAVWQAHSRHRPRDGAVSQPQRSEVGATCPLGSAAARR